MLISTGVFLAAAVILAIFLVHILIRHCIILYYLEKLPGPPKHDFLFGSAYYFGLDQAQIFRVLQEWNKTYFPIYKITLGFNGAVVLSGPEDFEVVTTSMKHIKKSAIYSLLDNWLRTGLLTSSGEKWQERRKILTPAFHFDILKNFIPTFNEESVALGELLKGECDKEYTLINPLISQFTLKAMAETSMGTKLTFETEKERNYKKALAEVVKLFIQILFKPWLHLFSIKYLFPTHRKEMKLVKILQNFTKEVIVEREKNFEGIPTGLSLKKRRLAMLDLLLSAKIVDGVIDDKGIHEEVDTFMFEGHDTVAAAICFSLMLLANHRDVQEKIVQEMVEIMGDLNKPPSLQDLQEMKYMERCIKEVLRLYPSVYFISRELGADTVTSSGYKLKEGTIIVLQIFGIHHNPQVYPEPEKFDPDRFLPENCQDRHPFAYVPFSAGPRNCIGQRFALLEMKALLYGILGKFVLEPVDTPESITLIADIILRTTEEIKVKFVRRN